MRADAQGAPAKAEEAKNAVKVSAEEVTKQESIVKAVALKLSELKGTVKESSATPTVPPNVDSMSVEDLKAQLTAWGVEADWDPTQDKAVLIERVTVRFFRSVQEMLFCLSMSKCARYTLHPWA
jgi:hypothetical protein